MQKNHLHIASAALALLVAFGTPAFANEQADAAAATAEHEARLALAHRMADSTLAIIKDQKAKTGDREELLTQSFARVVDIDWIAKFVLGNAWRTATQEQRERYTDLYRTFLTSSYVQTYAENPDRKITDIKVLSVRDSDADANHFTTSTQIRLSTFETVRVDYLVNKIGKGYKIIDVIIEDVSLLATHRAEFGKIAAARGVDGVITRLEQLVSARGKTLTLSMK